MEAKTGMERLIEQMDLSQDVWDREHSSGDIFPFYEPDERHVDSPGWMKLPRDTENWEQRSLEERLFIETIFEEFCRMLFSRKFYRDVLQKDTGIFCFPPYGYMFRERTKSVRITKREFTERFKRPPEEFRHWCERARDVLRECGFGMNNEMRCSVTEGWIYEDVDDPVYTFSCHLYVPVNTWKMAKARKKEKEELIRTIRIFLLKKEHTEEEMDLLIDQVHEVLDGWENTYSEDFFRYYLAFWENEFFEENQKLVLETLIDYLLLSTKMDRLDQEYMNDFS